jgi:hypothetical protein
MRKHATVLGCNRGAKSDAPQVISVPQTYTA